MLIMSLSYYIGVLSSRLKPRLKHLGVLSSRLKPRLKNIPKRIKINLILVVGASVEVLTTSFTNVVGGHLVVIYIMERLQRLWC